MAVPLLTPETTPPEIVATDPALLPQVPPAEPLEVNVAVVPAHKVATPEMVPATGIGLIVIMALAAEEPQLFVRV